MDFFSFFLPVWMAMFASQDAKAAEEKARERRMVEHRRNARLLRLNI